MCPLPISRTFIPMERLSQNRVLQGRPMGSLKIFQMSLVELFLLPLQRLLAMKFVELTISLSLHFVVQRRKRTLRVSTVMDQRLSERRAHAIFAQGEREMISQPLRLETGRRRS